MYYPGQIIYDRDRKVPVAVDDIWDLESYPERHTHFIRDTGKFTKADTAYEVAQPKTIEEAVDLLEKGLITPAAVPPDHHWRCGNWLTNCRCEDKS